jgi:hypothetical protein
MQNENKPMGLYLTNEGSSMLLRGLELLPDTDKKKVIYNDLKRELQIIKTMWERRIKNEQLIAQQRKSNRK